MKNWLCLVVYCHLLIGCFPVAHRVILTNEELQDKRIESEQAKVHLKDGSLLVFNKGFKVVEETVRGEGFKYSFKQDEGVYGEWIIPVRDVRIMSFQSESMNEGRMVGAALLALGPLVAIGALVYVLGMGMGGL